MHRESESMHNMPTGHALWRSLDELADTESFRQWLADEFPPGVLEAVDGVSRRQFLKIMAASFALTAAAGCVPGEPSPLAPYVREPVGVVPGKPMVYASALTRGGYARGTFVRTHMGRPIKIEGNPEHPATLGSSDVFMQAELLTFYDPQRSQAVYHRGTIDTWEAFVRVMGHEVSALRERDGRGMHLLTGNITSPTALAQLDALFEAMPEARWHVHEPITDAAAQAAAGRAFGQRVEMHYHFERATRIVSLDSDFLFDQPGSIRYARDFSDRRRVRREGITDGAQMNRLYVAEPSPTITGAKADHRLPLPATRLVALAEALAQALGVTPGAAASSQPPLDEHAQQWAQAAARDLAAHRGASLVLAGRSQPEHVHLLVHAINAALGNLGQTLVPIEPIANTAAQQPGTLAELMEAVTEGTVDTLIMVGVNPAYTAPADFDFATNLGRVRQTVHMGLYRDETARRCDWHLPLQHELESWSDARAFDGTASVIQPMIEPLHAGRSVHALLGVLLGQTERSPYEWVRGVWQARLSAADFESAWQEALRQGIVPGTQASPASVQFQQQAMAQMPAFFEPQENAAPYELTFAPDPSVWDGRYANNGWLQELGKPLSKITWDNAVYLSAATAAQLGVRSQQMLELRVGEQSLAAAAWVLPGQADGALTLSLGYGRSQAGQVGTGLGFNAYALRQSDALWIEPRVQVRAGAGDYTFATTQEHHTMAGREVVRIATIADFAAQLQQGVTHEETAHGDIPLTLYPEHPYPGEQWGMTIDLTTCIGCNACTIGCQAENNIPIVGKLEVQRGREMHWIRVDRYFEGAPEDPAMYHQPVPCMHCEKAPCEVVCPVGATIHSFDGLNEMTYNRCVGTRYCSNNCPYKVRRFNFFDYIDRRGPELTLMRNPDVTVRGRGVMEKCTYCVQRIRTAGINAKREDRPIHDQEVLTACQQACPTQAIVFGNINDASSQVARSKDQPHNYGLLADLNTQPRTTYLAAIGNPNPELQTSRAT